MERAEDVHAMKKKVTARDKSLAVTRPYEEAVKLLREKYQVTADSARAFIDYLRAVPGANEGATGTVNPREQWHMRYDETKGAWIKVDDRETAG